MDSILLGVTAAILIGGALIGYYRGLLKSVFALLSVVLSLVLMVVLQPVVGNVLKTATPVHEGVQSAVRVLLEDEMTKWLENAGASGIGGDLFADGETLPSGGETSSLPDLSGLGGSNEWMGAVLSPEQQEQLMEVTHLPDTLWKSGQNSMEMKADEFLDTISGSIADTVVNAISHLLTFVIVFLLIRVLYIAIGLMGKLPVLEGVNRMLGGLFGLLEGLLILWLLCQAVTILVPMGVGKEILAAIDGSPMLSVLYRTLMSFGR